mgnify:CR=1 FL=1
MDKIIGLGNALVDALAIIEDDNILTEMQLPKGSMTLIDEDKFLKISEYFSRMETHLANGGSAGNAIRAMACLGAGTGFIGKVSNDFYGNFFRDSLLERGTEANLLLSTTLPSGVASTFISPDGERTFGTYLGAASTLKAEDLSLDILYEDPYLLVINKPKGMVVHPCPGHYSGTLVNGVLFHCKGQLSGINGVLRPGIVHRIDKDTTGALVVCKDDQTHRNLAVQLAEHTITRRYRAIVTGNLSADEGTVEGPIGRHPVDRKKMSINFKNGKDAVTHYRVLERFGKATYIECRLETGRTHQIRVHLSSIGHPLLGDTVYGSSKNPYELQGQTLHAMVLGFTHPYYEKYVEFEAPLPEYFQKMLEKLRK